MKESATERPLKIVFIHLDLGIGGAEQLVLQLAHSVHAKEHEIELVTTRCDANHCFSSVAPGGLLHSNLRVWGRWIPQDVLGLGRALCSTLRLLYLALCVTLFRSPDVIILDVLPTPLPLLQWFTSSSLLFYCHFPDQLLTRSKNTSRIKSWYRGLLDNIEALTMGFADVCCVNSKFTRITVCNTFGMSEEDLPVLYPALDTRAEVGTTFPSKERKIVSLNRYERKKNLGLVIEAAAWLKKEGVKLPEIVIAGGYDRRNVENVEYRAELGLLADKLEVPVTFLQSISDSTRSELLRTALCVLYTPSGEHFGIVPLESMYNGTPVIAVNDGGPTETIIHEKTGFLCEPTATSFGQAIRRYLDEPSVARNMGEAGSKHVKYAFGPERLQREFSDLISEACRKGERRMSSPTYRLGRSLLYIVEALLILCLCWQLTWLLRQVGWIDSSESILGGIQKRLWGDEL